MHRLSFTVPAALLAAGAVAATGVASAPPVGPLPKGPMQTVKQSPGRTFTVTLPKSGVAGRTWRVARAYNSGIVREIGEGTNHNGAVWVTYRAVAVGTTRVVYALTRGEGLHAYAARTFRVVVSTSSGTAACPDLLRLTANPIAPAVAAALDRDEARNRPQATAAAIASRDTQRGQEVRADCGARVQERTVVVYITDRALLPNESASQRVFFVGRTNAGYRVWKRAR
jgi:hypothetical protein